MTKIKLCGLSRPCDIEAANSLAPEYIGFVFATKSKRRISPERAAELKSLLSPEIKAAGVFVDETPENIAALVKNGVIDIAQLHGNEDEAYMEKLRLLCSCPIIKAFVIKSEDDMEKANKSSADFVLLDSGAGTGTVFDWELIKKARRPYFLAGGLGPENAGKAVRSLHPYAVDVSSGIESDGFKDKEKMSAFVTAVREENKR